MFPPADARSNFELICCPVHCRRKGHMVALDVHDSPLASRPNGPSKHPLAKYLRFVGILEEGHVITNEPGCYFNPFLLKPFKDSPYLNHEVLAKYMPVGGVRIEDE